MVINCLSILPFFIAVAILCPSSHRYNVSEVSQSAHNLCLWAKSSLIYRCGLLILFANIFQSWTRFIFLKNGIFYLWKTDFCHRQPIELRVILPQWNTFSCMFLQSYSLLPWCPSADWSACSSIWWWGQQELFCKLAGSGLLYIVILVHNHHGYSIVCGQHHPGVIISQFFYCLLLCLYLIYRVVLSLKHFSFPP